MLTAFQAASLWAATFERGFEKMRELAVAGQAHSSKRQTWRAAAVGALLALTLQLALTGPAWAADAAKCQFVLGFKSLHDLAPADIGDCAGNQASMPNGDAQQQTANGLMVWRKADNWTAFTNGNKTWLNGPDGLAVRLNTDRFPWEADYGLATLTGPGWSVRLPTSWQLTTTGADSPVPGVVMAVGPVPRPNIKAALVFKGAPAPNTNVDDWANAVLAELKKSNFQALNKPTPINIRGNDGRQVDVLKDPDVFEHQIYWVEGGQAWGGVIAARTSAPDVQAALSAYFVNSVLPTLTIP